MDLANAAVTTLLILLVILFAGLLGGFAAYLSEPRAEAGAVEGLQPAPGLRRFLVVGVAAAACVPLFLSLVQSQLFANMQAGAVEAFFIFAGTCLVAAFSARQFLDTVTRQLLQQVREARETAAEALDKGEEALEIAENPAPPREPTQPESMSEADAAPVALTEGERKILTAATRMTHRTATGIAKDAGISRTLISERLESLAQRGLMGIEPGPKSGRLRWHITPKGMASLQQSG